MNPQSRSTFFRQAGRLGIALLLLVWLSTPLVGQFPPPRIIGNPPVVAPAAPPAPKKTGKIEPGTVEVQFRDDSKLKMILRVERIEMVTAYGKLLIPPAAVHQITFGFHIDADTAKRIDMLIGHLGSTDFKERQAATEELLSLGARAYPALVQASKSQDKEVVRRAEAVLEKLRDAIPFEDLERPMTDVIVTADCKFTGRIQADSFKVKTFQFGEQQIQLGDLRALRSMNALEPELVALPDPGTLMQYQDKIGQTFLFRVTGSVNSGTVWGTGVYTPDSPLAMAAVHAGVLKPDQTGVVKVTIVAGPPAYFGSTANGVTTSPWNGGFVGAFQVER